MTAREGSDQWQNGSGSPPRVNWVAAMITPSEDCGGAPLLRRSFRLAEGHGIPTAATLHISSLGVFRAFVNGRPVGDDVLSPGWTSYQWRLRYRTYDVLPLLEDESVLAVALGNGWYRGRLGWAGQSHTYGDRLGLVAQLDLEFEDGHRDVVATGPKWGAGRSAVLANDLYDGEIIDLRLQDDAWLRPGLPDAAWSPVEVLPFDFDTLCPYIGPPVVRHEHLRPLEISTSPSGRVLVDFGQNLTGWTKFRVRGPAGTEVSVAHAEVLEQGELGSRPLRTAKATDRYVLSGEDDVLEPALTFHGFRYAQVDGWPGTLSPDDVEAVVVHTDLRRIGTFECSNQLLNRLHRNVVWGLRGNALDVPTDCPQRDERLGWTGDLAVFAPAAAYLYDVRLWLTDWLEDLKAEQRAGGGVVPLVVPDPLTPQGNGSMSAGGPYAIWGDASIWVPWALWQAYGDRTILESQYASMTAHLRRVEEKLSPTGLWDRGFQFADWLDPDAPPDEPWRAKANPAVVATACVFRSASTVADVARVLGRPTDGTTYEALAERTRSAFLAHYLGTDGRIESDAPTVYALAIAFGLLRGRARQRAGDRLSELVRSNGYRVSTGFAGTPYILDALSSTGHLCDAYRMLLETSCPSWLYPVTMGATTIWERWDAMLPDGSINPGEMTSFNHYALGAVADWMHRTIGGLAPLAPGYERVRIAPRPGGDVTWATSSLHTPHGPVSVTWSLEGAEVTGVASLPQGASGVLHLPGAAPVQLGGGRHEFGNRRPRRP